MIEQFKIARNRAVPLIAIRTPDPADTILKLREAIDECPLIQWDFTQGMYGANDQGKWAVMEKIGNNAAIETQNPTEGLQSASKLPEKMILFMIFGHMFFYGEQSPSVITAIWKLRDEFKYNRRQLVLLCPWVKLPGELVNDFLVLDDPLPDEELLNKSVRAMERSFAAAQPDYSLSEESVVKAVSSVVGLARFPAEQALYMAATPEGINFETLGQRKRQAIESTPGLSLHRGGETFADVQGNESVKKLLSAELESRRPPKAIVYLDEIEKAIGTDMDTSGVSQSLKGMFLSWTEDRGVRGILCTGVAGTGKSLTYKAACGEAGIPGIGLSMAGMKGSLVGQSEERLFGAFRTIDAIGQGEAFVIATANNINILPPEIRARFYATFFFDLTTADELAALWAMYMKKYDLIDEIPESHNWVGREVRNCCDIAWRLKMPLVEAAKFIVPVSVSSSEWIMRMREEAVGRYLSASYPGPYQIESASERAQRSV